METNCKHCYKNHSLFYFKNKGGFTHVCYRCPSKTTKIQSKGILVYVTFKPDLPIPTEESKQLQLEQRLLKNQLPLF